MSGESTTPPHGRPPHGRVRATASVLGQRFGDAAFTWSDAEAEGVSRDRVERACAAGLIARVGRGWYVAVSYGQASQREQSGLDVVARGRLRALGDPAARVLCGTSAAAVWNLPLPPGVQRPRGVEILAESPQASWGGRRAYETVRRWKVRADFIVEGPHGVRVTDPLQTALDLGRGLAPPFALVALDAALRVAQGVGIPADVGRDLLRERVSAARGGRGLRGVITAATYADAQAESPLESIVRGRIIEAGLPVPLLQVRVVGRSGREYRSDLGLALPGDPPGVTSLLIEADGVGKYLQPGDLAAEKRRQHDLEGRGHRFVRVLYGEAVSAPEGFLEAIGRLVAGSD